MTVMDSAAILGSLPHRFPMLLVDRVIECDDKERIVAIKNVTINEPFFQGHFPGYPIMPGVLQLEAMAQTAGLLVNRIYDADGEIPFFMSIDKAKFRRVVSPGDQLRIEVNIINVRLRAVRFKGRILVGDKTASQAEMMCMLAKDRPA